MKIGKNMVASVAYELRISGQDKVIETVTEDKPHEFLFGFDLMIPGFEDSLKGLKAGDSFDFSVKSDEAYGPVDTYAIFDLPLDTFEENGKIDPEAVKVGNIFPMQDDEGNRHMGKIIKVMKDSVTMDFNHPLAGKDLRFAGKVIAVRLASLEDTRGLD